MQPVIFVSHGGGPLPLLNDPGHEELVRSFTQIKSSLESIAKPHAIVFISAHWEAQPISITASDSPGLYFDYYNFPAAAYDLKYPAPGNAALAGEIRELLAGHGIVASLDTRRGLDHGVFVPASLLFPEASIPCLQISLHASMDAATHLEIGRALAGLRKRNILIIGSGFSFHNMREFMGEGNASGNALNIQFEEWLQETLSLSSESERDSRLTHWENAPGARFCHPREEHLLPLHVCAAAAGSVFSDMWQFTALNKRGSCYMWRD